MNPRLLCLALLLCLASHTRAQSPPPCQVHVILFIPADARTPAGYQKRIDQIVTYTEAFFRRELQRWGHDKPVMPFRRAASGAVEVQLIRGRKKLADYQPVPLRAEVMDTLRAQNKINPAAYQVWWIFVYPGETDARGPFLGGFGQQIGGWALANLDMSPGSLDPEVPLAAGLPEKMMLKGMIHELGHAFRLPHVGPLQRDNLGNTLMGPTHINYRRVITKPESRVHLCEAEAAMLAMHPAFRGKIDTNTPLPKPQTSDLKYSADSAGKTITVTGRVRSSPPAVYALVADESDARPGEYWTKTYVGKIQPDGSFTVVITEPSESAGTLKTWFIFEDGQQTGTGSAHARQGALTKPYTHQRGQWTFN